MVEKCEPHFPPIHTGLAAERRLGELGLSAGTIHRAALHGNAARREVTALHPAAYAGVRMQAEIFGELAHQLVPHGWTKPPRMDDMLERVHSPDQSIAIGVNSGSSSVGDENAHPDTRRPRGSAGQVAVSANQGILFRLEAPKPTDEFLSYLLLFNVIPDEQHGPERIALEVSLPREEKAGHITAWEERIIVPPAEPTQPRPVSEAPTPPHVDVPIERRDAR